MYKREDGRIWVRFVRAKNATRCNTTSDCFPISSCGSLCRCRDRSYCMLCSHDSEFIQLLFQSLVDSAVGIATGHGMAGGMGVGVRVPVGRTFLLHVFQTGSGAHPASYLMCTGGSSPGVKRQVREADHLQLMPRSRKYGSIHPHLHTPSCHGA
jgi:hypothetical protein